MKNVATNTINYSGIVTLSQYSGSKKIKIAQFHNEGGDTLFNFLADCLVGDFAIAKLTRPTKVMLIERTNPDEEFAVPEYGVPIGSGGFIYLLTKPEKIKTTYGESRVRYSFIVQKEVINSISFDNIYLGLYTDEATLETPGNYAAICKLDLNKNNLVNASLVVDWELVISNIS
jgi:hypothetical protein